MKALSLACFCIGFAILPSAASSVAAQGAVFQSSVTPLPDEDLASDCRYEVTLTDRQRTIRGVWVIFDRGRDILRI
jgi:predicted ATPase